MIQFFIQTLGCGFLLKLYSISSNLKEKYVDPWLQYCIAEEGIQKRFLIRSVYIKNSKIKLNFNVDIRSLVSDVLSSSKDADVNKVNAAIPKT